MTVLHVLKTAVGGTWAYRQMRELVRRDVRVHVAMPAGPVAEACRKAGIHVHTVSCELPIADPRLLVRTLQTFRGLVETVKPDLIHSHFVGTTLTMRLALGEKHRIPRIFQVPGPLHLEHPFFRAAELWTAGAYDYWIGSCQWTCRRYEASGVPSDRVFLSYYGVDLDDCEARVQPSTRPVRFRSTPSTKVVGMVAYMYPPKRYLGQRRGLKGHEDLIDALQLCRRHVPDLVGVFVGGAWGGGVDYERRVVGYGEGMDCRNIFLGTRPDVAGLYREFDIAVCPSHSENVGAAVESLLAGIPTVASAVGGLPDIVRENQTGWLVPAKNPPALAEALLNALSEPAIAQRFARAGQQLARELFDVRTTAGQILSIYERILSGRPNETWVPCTKAWDSGRATSAIP